MVREGGGKYSMSDYFFLRSELRVTLFLNTSVVYMSLLSKAR